MNAERRTRVEERGVCFLVGRPALLQRPNPTRPDQQAIRSGVLQKIHKCKIRCPYNLLQ
ncbi:unnamed protein product [Ceutorhynchus assimilis]|uniref:Uncharacterized protein n=1 Tax=Ceutorhynchus assimilis TaxID=467358 RepID=A0A9N9MC05_9CUCU|nr:unnamed protein product [Ceutorhynchus assimilis]